VVALIVLSMFSLITFNVAVRAEPTDLTLSMPRSTPIIREVDGVLVPMPKQPAQSHWWDIDYWTTGSQLPPRMTGRFVAVTNTIGNLAAGDAVLYLPLNVAYGTSRNNCVWFQFDVQLDPNNVVAWYIWDINGPATNIAYWPSGDYHYTQIGIAYTPGDEYDFSLSTSGTNTITFTITDSTTGASWSKNNWVWTVPSLNMLYDISMFSPASAVEGYTANSQLTNVPYFQTKVGYGIPTFRHSAFGSGAPSGISSDVNVDSSGYYYWYMYDGSTNAKTVIYALNWLRNQQSTDGAWSYDSYENVGITSLSALAFMNYGVIDGSVKGALEWVLSKRQPGGSIDSGAVSREDNRVYETSMAILALVAGNILGYVPSGGTNLNNVINNAVTFLRNAQCVGTAIDGYTYTYDNQNYGGWGYPRSNWADLSNTQFAVLGLAAATIAGISTVPLSVWQNAAVFTIRCLNDQNYNPTWYNTNDGGFTYRPKGGSYESMTGAGVWSLGLCKIAGISSVTVDTVSVSLDNAINDGVNWLQTYPYVDRNYGYSPNNYFYYYTLMSVAKGYLIVNQGMAWYTSMVTHLVSSQAADGHWPSTWWEEPDTMATAEALLAIETRIPNSNIPTSLYVVLASSSNLYITDPEGKHLGIDPNTGQVVNEIPDAVFSANLEQTAYIPYPLIGYYSFSVFGTGTGPYHLTVAGEVSGKEAFIASFTGMAFPGVARDCIVVTTRVVGPLTVLTVPTTHDVAVTSVNASRAWVYQGFSTPINVTVINNGDFVEDVDVTFYYNITSNDMIGTQTITLSPGQNQTIVFIWNTAGVPYCHNYTITAVADIPVDINPAGNTLDGGKIKVRILGDLNGDGTVDLKDVYQVALAFGTAPGDARWNVDADINDDGQINVRDYYTVCRNFGKSCPP